MKIEDILKKQGEIYKNLHSNKTIQKYNEEIKPKLDVEKPSSSRISGDKLFPPIIICGDILGGNYWGTTPRREQKNKKF